MSRYALPLTIVLGIVLLALLPRPAAAQVRLDLLGRYSTGRFAQGAAEIGAYDAVGKRFYFVSAVAAEVFVLDVQNPARPRLLTTLDLRPFGAGVNSVAVAGGRVAVAVEASPKTEPGQVVFFQTDGTFRGSVRVGALPDALTFSPDGLTVAVACEGEPASDYSADPEGSVWLVPITPVPQSPAFSPGRAQEVGFRAFNANGPRVGELPAGVRIYGPNASVAQDLEPEYVAFSPDGAKVYVTLQENNALALIDVASASVERIVALGYKNHNLPGQGLDPSDRDGANNGGAVRIQPWPVFGMYQPDGLAAFAVGGQTYLALANEGDARDYSALAEEARVSTLTLDAARFPNGPALKANSALGRLTVTNRLGDGDRDGDYDSLFVLGARSFSIRRADGSLLWDSGDRFEQLTASLLPGNAFNATNDANNSFDTRSDNKGPEPEGVVVGQAYGRTLAFVGLERVGGVFVYDVSNPAAPVLLTYANPRSFAPSVDPNTPAGLDFIGDLGPEGLVFIPAADSPTGVPLLATLNEVSGTVAFYGVLPTSTAAEGPEASEVLALHVAPQPARGRATVTVRVPEGAVARLSLHDLLGREVALLADGLVPATLDVPLDDLAPGVYTLQLVAEGRRLTQRVVHVP